MTHFLCVLLLMNLEKEKNPSKTEKGNFGRREMERKGKRERDSEEISYREKTYTYCINGKDMAFINAKRIFLKTGLYIAVLNCVTKKLVTNFLADISRNQMPCRPNETFPGPHFKFSCHVSSFSYSFLLSLLYIIHKSTTLLIQ